ncbi:MAG: DEAD/DEAH box helicase [Microlunatus sp.]
MSEVQVADRRRSEAPMPGLPMPGLNVRHVRELPPRTVRHGPWPSWLTGDSPVRLAVESSLGIDRLWAHQSVAADALAAGRHVVLTTGTASGKSLAYLLPLAAAAVGAGPEPSSGIRWRRRPATSLYLAPTKALAHDQLRACTELAVPGWRVATVDGDTEPAERRWARDHAHHVLTNPDLVHASLLPNHARWASFLRSLRYVVVDESHRYRGIFGAQVAAVLRRLRRVAAHYGADPAFVVLSATTAEPERAAAALTGIDAESLLVVSDDGSPRGPVRISLAAAESNAEDAAGELMAERIRNGRQVLTFAPSRRLAEEIARSAAQRVGPGGGEVVAYRAGYLATDRRAIERGLNDGSIRGVAATNALELGVDIAGLDTVVLCGYPGQRAAFWQQAGRAGRRGGPAEVVLIARPHPVDGYLLDHPETLFGLPVEAPVLNPESPPVLGPQLAAAAQELPLRPGDERWFGTRTWPITARLTDLGLLRKRPDGWYWTSPNRAVDRINLRTADSSTLDIVDLPTGRVLGTVSAADADRVVHPGAVYLHQGDTYLCGESDQESGEVYVRANRPGYLTQPQVTTEVRPGPSERDHAVGGGRLAYGPVQVRSRVEGYLRRDEVTGQVWDSTPLD